MGADTGTPLCTWAQFTEGAFADLARNYTDPQARADLLLEATRTAEGMAGGRRLVPFTNLVESHRAQGIDPDEYGTSASLPMDMAGTLGRSYANAIGAGELVRHCWVSQYATRYPDMWAYTSVSVTAQRSYGGSQTFSAAQIIGPEPDSGHIWFQLGTFLPIGSRVLITYSGGYTIATPATLVRAAKLIVASLIVRELQPNANSRDPDQLTAEAEAIIAGFGGE